MLVEEGINGSIFCDDEFLCFLNANKSSCALECKLASSKKISFSFLSFNY